ncbi:MAG: helix-turn-helix domain-containing protein [Candidatus Cryptobacteroides sp.]
MESLPDIGLKQLVDIVPPEDVTGVDDDFFIFHIRNNGNLEILKYPCRCNAYMIMFCNSGQVEVEINLNTYIVKDYTMLVSSPGNILKISRMSDPSSIRFTVLAVSPDFVSSLSFDLKKLFNDRLNVLSDPCFRLTRDSMSICNKYFSLLSSLASSTLPDKKRSIGSLMSSFFYCLGSALETPCPGPAPDLSGQPSSTARANLIYKQFISLVAEFHTSCRRVSFYAERMGLSPKYLSKMIKQVSGRSAPEWIDAYVILEAKNMLKYTGYSIGEIVRRLHFADAAVFHKFFKAHTGMTPLAYRNS